MAEDKTTNRSTLALVVIFIVGALIGFGIKASIKSKITSSPDDRKITSVKQNFDFKAAQQRIDKEMQDLQSQQEQQPSGGDTVPAPTPTPTPGQGQ